MDAQVAELQQILAREWRYREQQRHELFQTKLAEVEALVVELKDAIRVVKQRAAALRNRRAEEEATLRAKHDEYTAHVHRTDAAARALEADYAAKTNGLTRIIESQKEQITSLTREKQELWQALQSRPDLTQQQESLLARTQAELQQTRDVMHRLQQERDAAEQGKVKYKSLWNKAVRHLAAFRKQQDQLGQRQAEQRRLELEAMKQAFLEYQEAKETRHDAQHLETLRRHLAQQLDASKRRSTEHATASVESMMADLQQSGLYDPDDPLFQRLERAQ